MANAKWTAVNSDASESLLPFFHRCPVTYWVDVLAADVPCGLLFLSDNWDLLCTYIMCLLQPEPATFQLPRAGNYLFSPPYLAIIRTMRKKKKVFLSEWFLLECGSDGLCRDSWKATLTFFLKQKTSVPWRDTLNCMLGHVAVVPLCLAAALLIFDPQAQKHKIPGCSFFLKKKLVCCTLSQRFQWIWRMTVSLCLHPELSLH